MDIYILSSEAISCQDTFDKNELFVTGPELPSDLFQKSLSPDFKQYIDARLIRRMSGVLRMGVATAASCLRRAGLEKPDSIIVGTGLGCMDDTVKFLNLMFENKEQLLNPTPFIQSTHNTIAGQIALMMGCKGHNLTYSQKSLSFAAGLLDAMMVLRDGEAQNILVGGIDELHDAVNELIELSGCVNPKDTTFYSEGAAFFLLSTERGASSSRLLDIKIFLKVSDEAALKNELSSFLEGNNLTLEDIDLLVSGENGSSVYDGYYEFLKNELRESSVVRYKHLTGEHQSATAFGLFLAARMIESQRADAFTLLRQGRNKDIGKVLLFNYSKNADFSFILLQKV